MAFLKSLQLWSLNLSTLCHSQVYYVHVRQCGVSWSHRAAEISQHKIIRSLVSTEKVNLKVGGTFLEEETTSEGRIIVVRENI